MSVEGMWAVYFGDVDQQQVNSGIVVLETGRIFGGDSLIAYRGTYSVSNGHVQGSADTWAYNPTLEAITAFGEVNPEPAEVILDGHLGEQDGSQVIEGVIWKINNPGVQLPTRFVKICDLP
jgi:hypothetical protein